MLPVSSSPRAAPAWLISESYEDQPLGVLRSGKEAEVFLVERSSSSRSCLLAHKRFRPRTPRQGELRELGFSKGTIYHHDLVYRQAWFLNSRDRRAVAKKTAHGREVTANLWPLNEFVVLQRAWDAGVSVPYPVERTEDGLLMEYLGDRSGAAPRVAEARLDRGQIADAWRQLTQGLRALAGAKIVHADLSVYNLLWWQGRLVVIDFPQAVDATTNQDAPDLLHRDVVNVATWFGRRGMVVDAEAVFLELLESLLT